jgi:hypothetical protein
VNALEPGPASTLVADWFTWPFVTLVAVTAGIWFAVFTIRAIRHDRLDAMSYDPQPEPHECNITGCHQPATNAFPTGIPGVDYYACEGHTPTVRAWAGPYDHDVPYDQELDTIDLGRWEQEMQS